MRLIDANALMEFARNQKSRSVDCNDIARFPIINPDSLRPKGRWEEHCDEERGIWYFDCPFCEDGYATGTKYLQNFCPNCGADMTGDVHDE